MNCGICFAYLRKKNKCPACRDDGTNKPITKIQCKIKSYKFHKNNKAKHCFECEKTPCDNLKHLDKRYRARYTMNIIEYIENIMKFCIRRFVKTETMIWACSEYNGTICVHNRKCYVMQLFIEKNRGKPSLSLVET
jgi:hypothetical protein